MEKLLFDKEQCYISWLNRMHEDEEYADMSPDAIDRIATELFCDEWDQFKGEMKCALSDYVLCAIVTLYRWDGIHKGTVLAESFDELVRFFSYAINVKVVDDNGELKMCATHHDGLCTPDTAVIRLLTEKGMKRYDNNLYEGGRVPDDVATSLAHVKCYTKKANVLDKLNW